MVPDREDDGYMYMYLVFNRNHLRSSAVICIVVSQLTSTEQEQLLVPDREDDGYPAFHRNVGESVVSKFVHVSTAWSNKKQHKEACRISSSRDERCSFFIRYLYIYDMVCCQ